MTDTIYSIPPTAAVRPTPPAPPPYSLIASANPVDETAVRWEAGLGMSPLHPQGGVWSPYCDPDGDPLPWETDKTDPRLGVDYVLLPAIVETVMLCKGVHTPAEVRQSLLASLDLVAPAQVEAQTFDNPLVLPGNWSIRSAGTEDLTPGGGAVNVRYAVGLLEEALGQIPAGRGMIHVPAVAGPMVTKVCDVQRQRLVTRSGGHTVVIGTGYPNVDPTGAAPASGDAWLYATVMLSVRQGDVQLLPDPNDRQAQRVGHLLTGTSTPGDAAIDNWGRWRAERAYLVSPDLDAEGEVTSNDTNGTFAVEVDLTAI